MPVRIRVCALGALIAHGCGGKVNAPAHEGASTGAATTVTTSDGGSGRSTAIR